MSPSKCFESSLIRIWTSIADSSLCIFISFLQSVEMANVQVLDSVLIFMQECISAVLLQGV